MQDKLVKVGLIGLGRMGQNHLRVLSMLKNVEIVFIYDIDLEKAKAIGASHAISVTGDVDQFLRRVDAVIIASPTFTHADYVTQVAKQVKNIFVEKPLADTLSKARSLWNLCQENSLNVQVGFIERYNPAIQQLKNVLDQSRKVVSIDFSRTNKISSRITDVDVITDLMIHDIDLALYLSGSVQSVSAHGFIGDKMIDYASVMLTHTNGHFSRLQASRITDKKARSIQATCVDMHVDCDLLRKEIIINRQTESFQKSDGPYVISSFEETVEIRPQEALLTELQTFILSCLGKDVDKPDALDGLKAMRICDEVQSKILN
jgi:predicted dehydrogenase